MASLPASPALAGLPVPVPDFLLGGGEMGARIRGHDWASHPLGPPRGWPQPLRTALRVLLNTGHPMYVFWGPEGFCFYNDAYSASIGPERHPGSLGRPAREVWEEIWPIIGPQIDQVMGGGEGTWHENALVPITRHGRTEDVYWTYSFGPLDDARAPAGVGGVVVSCKETTRDVVAARHRAFRLALNRSLHVLATAPEMMDAATRRLGEHLGVARVGFGEVDAAQAHLSVRRDWNDGRVPSVAGAWRLEDFGPEFVRDLKAGQTVAIPDIARDPRTNRPDARAAYASLGTQAVLDVPLVRDGRMVAMLFIHHPEPRTWTAEEVEVVEEACGRLWDAVERARTEARLREREALLSAFVEALPGVVFAKDRDGRLTMANRGVEGLIGRPLREIVGRTNEEFIADQEQARVISATDRRVMEGGEPEVVEERVNLPDGRPTLWLSTKKPLRDAAGEVVGLVGVSLDITERRATEERLRESEARFRALTDAMPQMVWSTLPDGAHDYYNARWYEFTGVPPGSVDGEGWLGLFHPDDRAASLARWRRSLATGEPYETEFRLRRRDGAFRWTLARALPVRGADGSVARWFGTSTDVHEAKEASEALARGRDELERLVEARTAELLREVEERRRAQEALRQGEKLAAIGQLTGGIAHDFNNILQVVSSGATLLRHPRLPEHRREAVLDGLTKAAESAKELTSRLLAFARKQALQPEAFDANARLEGLSELLRHTLGSLIRVETDFEPGLWRAHADPGQFDLVVLNLAANARDAMLPGGGALALQTRNTWLDATPERAAGEYVSLRVTDTGRGMSPAVMARVFEPFFTTKGPTQGTGLGLAQAHGFAMQSGGDIAVDSAPGEGTTVVLHLPRATAAQLRAPAPAAEPVGAALERTAGKTVLVVDDNADVATFAASMLESLGYHARRAGAAAEALAILDGGEAVDAVFSDVVMPGMNGIELASTLRLRHPGVAVVLASGYSEELTRRDGKPIAQLLSKPYRLDDLAAALESAFAALAPVKPPA